MLRYLPVRKVHARQVLDSRGNPTVEAEVTVGEGIVGINGYTGRAMVPSGASTGKFEAVELRDGNREEYLGQSVKKTVENINTRLADAIIGENALNQAWIDHLLIETDGTENKSSAGANATLAVSLAAARAAAGALRLPLYQYLGGCHTPLFPVSAGFHWSTTGKQLCFRRSPSQQALQCSARLLPMLPVHIQPHNRSVHVQPQKIHRTLSGSLPLITVLRFFSQT